MWPWSTIKKLRDDLAYTEARFLEEATRANDHEATNATLTRSLSEMTTQRDNVIERKSDVEETLAGLRTDAAAIERENGLLKSQVADLARVVNDGIQQLELAQTQGAEAQRRYEQANDLANRLTEQLAQATKNDQRDPTTGRFVKGGLLNPGRDSLLESSSLDDVNGRLA